MYNNYKNESLVILLMILFILILYSINILYRKIFVEPFESNGNSNNSKRNKLINIYKNDSILDPDEDTNDEFSDPDSTNGHDPDA